MKKIVPFDNMVLVKVLEEEIKSGIIMPETHQGRFIRYQLIAVGPTVSWQSKVKLGDVVVGNPTPQDEEIEKGIKLINSKDIFAKEEKRVDS